MNKDNQKAYDLFIESLKKKQLSKMDIEEYSQYILIYLDEYLKEKTYIDGLTKLNSFFKDFLVKHYPLISTHMIEVHLKTLKRFYTVIYGKDLITYEQYAKVFDWLVYKGDALVEEYKQTKMSVKH